MPDEKTAALVYDLVVVLNRTLKENERYQKSLRTILSLANEVSVDYGVCLLTIANEARDALIGEKKDD